MSKIIEKKVGGGSADTAKYLAPEITVVEFVPEGVLCASEYGGDWEDFGESPWE
ncbi:MAG: hypothetical protein NC115_04295 [Bacteroidales bacterium]|nr:hypothetical protein [Bacteroides sp.]MCM1197350.1 hypothetical protein [Clostridium sp.]MCM1501873.1 hypothetical protein [Bacteroidales bacterium]